MAVDTCKNETKVWHEKCNIIYSLFTFFIFLILYELFKNKAAN